MSVGYPDTSGGKCVFLWEDGNGTSLSTGAQYSFVADSTMTLVYIVTDTTMSSCAVTTDTVTVFVFQPSDYPVAGIVTDTLTCIGATAMATATGSSPWWLYEWQPTGDSTNQTSVQVDSTSLLTLIVSDARATCASDTATAIIAVIPEDEMPTANAGNDTLICEGQMVMLGTADTSGGFWSYLWAPNGETQPQITPSQNDTTQYVLTVSHPSGLTCADARDTVVVFAIQQNAFPIADAGEDTLRVCRGNSVSIGTPSNGAWLYHWSARTENGSVILSDSTSAHILVAPQVPTTYYLEVLHSSGLECTASRDTVYVELNCPDGIVMYPNPFDESFWIRVRDDAATEISVEVYNAIGQLILNDELQMINEENLVKVETMTWASGVYVVRVNAGSQVYTRKMVKGG